MNIKKKLLNPFVLTAQGFLVGAALFWSIQPADADMPAPSVSSSVPAVQQIAGI